MKRDTPEAAYIDMLLLDLETDLTRFAINRPIYSIFIGGGTPSLFNPESFERLLNGIRRLTSLSDAAEITLEANPGTFESNKFAEFRALGINRLSIGVQTFNDALLKRLGRVHNAGEAQKAAEIAHQAGFDNFNLDLMFGLPDAPANISQQDIATAIQLNPTHISFYQLTLEPNTFFYKYPPPLPGDDEVFTAQLACQAILAQHGFSQYEISAYSKPGLQCQHNLNYWRFGDYLGVGAGAHGKISMALPQQIIRSSKPKHPEHYLRDFTTGSTTIAIKPQELPLEFLMNQLRLKQGFNTNHFETYTGLAAATLEPALSHCVEKNLLERDGGHYTCTEQGWNFLDSLLENFILS